MKNIKLIYRYIGLCAFSFIIFFNTNAQEKKNQNIKTDSIKNQLIYYGNNVVRNKISSTSAISKVSGDKLRQINSINPGNSMFGLLPGLTVMGNSHYFIRGINSMNSNSIVTLIDGVESNISSINVNDIENVEVLKDAAALAIYGQRAANSILLITTRQGQKQKMNVSLNMEMGIIQPTELPDFYDAYKYANAVNTARRLDGETDVLYNEMALQAYKDGSSPYFYPNIDWLDETLRNNGYQSNIDVSFRGGGNKVSYFCSLDYRSRDGLYKDFDYEDFSTQQSYDRVSYRANLDIDLSSTTKLKVWAAGNIEETNTPGEETEDIFKAIYKTPANAMPIKYYDNNWGGTSIYGNNPVAMISSTGYNRFQGNRIFLKTYLSQDLSTITKGLSADFSIAHHNFFYSSDSQTKKYKYEQLVQEFDASGVVTDTISRKYGDNSGFKQKTGIQSLARHTSFSGKINYDISLGNNKINSFLLYNENKTVSRGQYKTFITRNIAGNVHFGHKNKYFADVTLSYSGTNVLPKENRFSFYPAVSAAWVISNEDFMSNSSFINFLKLRASWGYAGNNRIRQNTEDTSYGKIGSYYFTDNNTSFGTYGEKMLGGNPKTELAMMSNVGLEINLLKKFNIIADVFYNKRTNILVPSKNVISGVLGVEPDYEPTGEVSNKGIDLLISWSDKIGNFKYSIAGTFNYSKNKIENMNEIPRQFKYQKRTGLPVGQAFGLISDGFFNSQDEINSANKQLFSTLAPGDIRYVDQNNDNLIDNFDQVAIGYNTKVPEIYYGLNINAEYKNFGINALIQGIANYTVYLKTPSIYWPLVNNNNITSFSDNAWTPETPSSATLPRLTTVKNNNNYRTNDIWLKNGNFIKLRNLEVYYLLSKSIANKIHLENIKFFARGTNLLSIDDIEQLDPEQINGGYPMLKTYNFGINLTF